jgi:hypothetical protein
MKEMFILTSLDDIDIPYYLKTLISKIYDMSHIGFPQKLLENLSIFASHSLFSYKRNHGASPIIFLELHPA